MAPIRECTMDTDQLFAFIRKVLERPGYAVESIVAEKKSGKTLCIKVNGKRCRAQLVTSIRTPNKGGLGYARVTGPSASSDERGIISIIAIGDEVPYFYAIPRNKALEMIRDQGHKRRDVDRSGKTFHVPYPARPGSDFEEFRDTLEAFT